VSLRERLLWKLGWRYWSILLVDDHIVEQWAGRAINCDDPNTFHWLGHYLRYCPKAER
jgi:hypothetical protein